MAQLQQLLFELSFGQTKRIREYMLKWRVLRLNERPRAGHKWLYTEDI